MIARAAMAARYIRGIRTGASSRDTVSTRRILVGDSTFPSLAALSWVSATFKAVRSLSRWDLICALSAFAASRRSPLIRRASFLAASLASSLARALIARASARRVARLFRLRNRPIPGRLPGNLAGYRVYRSRVCAIREPTLIGMGEAQPLRWGWTAG